MRRHSCGTPLAFALLAIAACGHRPDSAVQPAMSKDAAFAAIRAAILAEPAIFKRVEYNPTEPAVVAQIDRAIEDAVEKRYFKKWPASLAQAKSYAFTIKPAAWGAVIRSDEGRAAIEAKIQAHWTEPPTRPLDNGVVADLGVCPGKIEHRSNSGWTIAECPHNDRSELAPGELVRVIEALRAKFPAAGFYQVDAILNVHFRTPERLSYRYVPARDELVLSDGTNTYSSPEPIGKDLQRLINGAAPVRKQDLRMWAKSTRTGVRGAQ